MPPLKQIYLLLGILDGDNDINASNPYVIDKSDAKNYLRSAGGVGTFTQNDETGIGTGKSFRLNKKELGCSTLINGGAIEKFTIAFWFKQEDYSDVSYTYPVFFNSSAGFRFYSNNRIYFYINGAGGLSTIADSFTRNKWYYVVGSYDGSNMKIWLDGDLVAEKSGVAQTYSFAGKRMFLGYASSSSYFNGWLDEVMFFPYAFNGKKLE